MLILAIGGPLLATRPAWLSRLYRRMGLPQAPPASGGSTTSASDR